MLASFSLLITLALMLFSFGVVGALAQRLFHIANAPAISSPLTGWAIYVFISILLGVLTPFGVPIATLALFGGACAITFINLIRKENILAALPFTFAAGFALLLPLLYFTTLIMPHAWDDFSHWLPNAHFLFSYGRFPVATDATLSAWPAYPYGFTLIQTALNWLSGSFQESTGPLLNLSLLALFTAVIVDEAKLATTRLAQAQLFAALFFILVFVHPAFNQYLLFSSYSDYPTAILLGLFVYALWHFFERGAQKPEAFFLAMLAILFLQLRQANIFLLIIALVAFGVNYRAAFLKHGKILGLALLPALLLWGAWQLHAASFAGAAGFSAKGHFQFELVLPLLAGMGTVAIAKSGYVLMLSGFIAWAGWRARKPCDAFDAPIKATALICVGYFVFLFLAYLGSGFSEYEIRSAASFYRYLSHLHLAVFIVLFFALLPRIKTLASHHAASLKYAGWFFILALPVFGLVAGFFHLLPKPAAEITALRAYAVKILPQLPAHKSVGLLIPAFDGLESNIARYQWALTGGYSRMPWPVAQYNRFDFATNPAHVQDFAVFHDSVMVGPNDSLAWKQFGQKAENHWATFRKHGLIWTEIEP